MLNRIITFRLRTLSLLITLLLTACAVGPDFVPPEPLPDQRYTEEPELEVTLSEEQAVDPEWWRLYQNEALNCLVERALHNSPTLESAVKKLNAVQELFQAEAGYLNYPRIDANAAVTRQKVNFQALGITTIPSPPPFTLYNIGTSLSYTFDVFGRNHRLLESLGAMVDYQRYEWIASQITLATNVVTAVIQMSSLTEQVCFTEDLLALQQQQLCIMENQLASGGLSEHDLIQKRLQISDTESNLKTLQKQLAQNRHQIAIYLGETPATAMIPTIRLSELTLPTVLPISIPADLIQQRPDIQASMALLHASSALIGVATAEMLPQITITGNLNTEALAFNKLFGPGSSAWAIGPGLLQPLFHGGQLLAQRRAAIAANQEALANYQNTVLKGVQNVADTLKALEMDGKAHRARCDATTQAKKDYGIALRQLEIGSKSHFSLLDSQQAYYQQIIAEAPILANRLADSAALYQALGGGWWHKNPCWGTSVAAYQAIGGSWWDKDPCLETSSLKSQ